MPRDSINRVEVKSSEAAGLYLKWSIYVPLSHEIQLAVWVSLLLGENRRAVVLVLSSYSVQPYQQWLLLLIYSKMYIKMSTAS